MLMKTEAIKILKNKTGKPMRKWAKRMIKPAERLKMPSQRKREAQMALMLHTDELEVVLMRVSDAVMMLRKSVKILMKLEMTCQWATTWSQCQRQLYFVHCLQKQKSVVWKSAPAMALLMVEQNCHHWICCSSCPVPQVISMNQKGWKFLKKMWNFQRSQQRCCCLR